MRRALGLFVGLAFVGLGCAGGGSHTITAKGVRLVVPEGWDRVRAASPGTVTDPRTLLVVGTAGVRPKSSRCLIAAYRVPADGAFVVVVGWRSVASAGGGPMKQGRAPLKKLVTVTSPSFECFTGRGAGADLLLGGKRYQVSVLVGDRASKDRVAEALAVGRSFERTGGAS
jgi:hypothetical protein